jgi:hypothetical protein
MWKHLKNGDFSILSVMPADFLPAEVPSARRQVGGHPVPGLPTEAFGSDRIFLR